MIRRLLLLNLLFIASTSFTQTREESEVMALSRRKFRWMVSAQVDSLKEITDERLSYIHSSGWVQSRQEFLDDFTNGKLVYHDIKVNEMTARVYRKSAVVTGKMEATITMEGSKGTTRVMFTEVYVLQKGGWRLVSRHASRLP